MKAKFLSIAVLALLATTATGQNKPPEYRVPDYQIGATASVTTAAESLDWSIDDLNIPAVWKAGITGKGTVGTIADTGLRASHKDIVGSVLSATDYTQSPSGAADKNGHGTWCFGAVFSPKNGYGLIGVAYEAKGRSRKVLGDGGSGSTLGITKAVYDAADAGDYGISLSLGGGGRDDGLLQALRYACSKGCLPVIAAGNSGPAANTVEYPGRFAEELPLIVCVAAHDRTGKTAVFSSRGRAVVVTGPGVDTRAPWASGDNDFAPISGTSMSTPRIFGIYLLWCQQHAEVPASERCERFIADLIASCDQYPKRDTLRGYGKPDAYKCVFAKGTAPVPPVVPPTVPKSVTVTDADLIPAKRAELIAAGASGFSITLTGTAPAVPRQMSYSDVYHRVSAGESLVWVSDGGIVPAGEYECYREGGKPMFRLRQAVHVVTQPIRNVVPLVTGGCPGGVCPLPRR